MKGGGDEGSDLTCAARPLGDPARAMHDPLGRVQTRRTVPPECRSAPQGVLPHSEAPQHSGVDVDRQRSPVTELPVGARQPTRIADRNDARRRFGSAESRRSKMHAMRVIPAIPRTPPRLVLCARSVARQRQRGHSALLHSFRAMRVPNGAIGVPKRATGGPAALGSASALGCRCGSPAFV
jgi:hypothetical protein